MPRVIYSPAALRDLERLRAFLRPKSASAARRAAETILSGMRALAAHPQIGRPVDGLPEPYREWLIGFGDSGYVARYRLESDAAILLAIRHQKELGY